MNTSTGKMPELLLPAGTLEKGLTGFVYGADSVYAAGQLFGLRAFAGNLSDQDMQVLLQTAQEKGKKIYITVNILAHNNDIELMPAYLEKLASLPVDGLIVSDLGVISLASKYARDLPITVSTQASVTNYAAAAQYKELGAQRIVLARELSLEEIRKIKEKVDIELEIFVHGAMCVSYSGRCLLSHYMTGRDANRGACAQPCRYKYFLQEEKRPGEFFPLAEDERGTYIMNSRDLCLLQYLPALIEAGVDALKIEGRMKSPLYVAMTGRVYRQALDSYQRMRRPFTEEQLQEWLQELSGVATRDFTAGFISGEKTDLQELNRSSKAQTFEFCGIVRDYDADQQRLIIEQRYNFGIGDQLELLLQEDIIPVQPTAIYDETGASIDRARHPQQIVALPWNRPYRIGALLRRVCSY